MLANISSGITVLVFITFVVIVIWAWSSNRTKDFDEAARLPLDDNNAKEDKHV